jgi:hypothetical protein
VITDIAQSIKRAKAGEKGIALKKA